MNHPLSSNRPKILLVDDEVDITENLTEFLRISGYDAVTAANGVEALEKIESEQPQLMVLDIDMPKLSGLEVLKELREKKHRLPIIILSKISELKIDTLKSGAISFLEKPFRSPELVANIDAILMFIDNSSPAPTTGVLTFGELKLCPSSREVTWKDEPVKLQPRQYKLLEDLMQNPLRWFSKEHLLHKHWGDSYYSDSVLKKCISGIRDRLPGIRNEIKGYDGGYKFMGRVQ